MTTTMAPTSTEVTAETELARFFIVARTYNEATGDTAKMPACPVDTAWHELLDDPKAFAEFVTENLGPDVTVDHLEMKGHGEIAWVSMYEAAYGPLPAIWFQTPDGGFNEAAWTGYLETGSARLSWDCGPGVTGGPHSPTLSWDCGPGFTGKPTAPTLSWDCGPGFTGTK